MVKCTKNKVQTSVVVPLLSCDISALISEDGCPESDTWFIADTECDGVIISSASDDFFFLLLYRRLLHMQ